MKAVLISIQPKWCELIASGKKTVEVRKTKPKQKPPFKVYIYCTKDEPLYRSGEKFWCGDDFGNGKVVGEFVCNNIDFLNERDLFDGMDEISNSRIEEFSCVSIDELLRYKGKKQEIYGWHISDLVIYDKPKELSEFKQCHKCEYYANCFEHELSCDGIYNLKRPPQSWCYVEEVRQ